MFEIGKGKELSENEFNSILKICFIMTLSGLLIIFSVKAETIEQSYSAIIKVGIDTGTNIINVTFDEATTNTYPITNSTNSFTVNFKRNASCSDSSASNISSSITSLSSTCQKIAEAYGDSSSFYKQLLECTTTKTQCEKDKESFGKEKDGLKGFESNYNTCINEKKNADVQFTACNIEHAKLRNDKENVDKKLKDTQSKSSLYGWGLLIAVAGIVGYYYKQKKKEELHPLEGTPPQ